MNMSDSFRKLIIDHYRRAPEDRTDIPFGDLYRAIDYMHKGVREEYANAAKRTDGTPENGNVYHNISSTYYGDVHEFAEYVEIESGREIIQFNASILAEAGCTATAIAVVLKSLDVLPYEENSSNGWYSAFRVLHEIYGKRSDLDDWGRTIASS